MTKDASAVVVAFWSDGMMKHIENRARGFHRRTGRDYEDFYQAGCLAAAELRAETRSDVVSPYALDRRVRHHMRAVYRRERGWGRIDRRRLSLSSRPVAAVAHRTYDDDPILDIREAVERLPPKHRLLIWMRYREYRSIQEIGAIHGVKPETVTTQTTRAYKLLQDAVDDGYNAAEVRARTAKTKSKRAFAYVNNRADWSTWGPIPDQRDDD